MTTALAAFLYARRLVEEDASFDHQLTVAQQVKESLLKLRQDLDQVPDDADEPAIQSVFYEAGKLHFKDRLRWWFQVLYQAMLSENEGPRLGQFTKLMSIYWVQDKIDTVIQDYWSRADEGV